ncbi:LysR family transcriptional regulator [Zhengella mangrovi]|uniref:LysR family transcriptional regulator n=1 Tax=Zhengella mangrovi TaxID=1982044 RepID=A0A2G1QJH0_9HYPH|nr:LysR family transcriptional regulator [Zhengella mangrovi]PHP65677.1 LysR family transcriptional regulator [Zhengella mangrovi]
MLKPYEQRFPWNLDWNLLRTFMVVVEQKSISRAGDFLGLKQPTISSALKRLEETTGHLLVERKPNRFRVTQAGALLYSECAAIFGAVSQLPALLDASEEEMTGHVGIVMASHVVSPHLDAALERFARQNPRVTFSIAVTESADVVSRISQNRASFGVCLVDTIPKTLDARVLFREFFGLYCGPRHRLFNREHLTIADLKGEDSVSFQTEIEGGPLDSVARLRERAKLAPGPRGVSSNLTEVRRMIVANIGIGALPVHVAERDVKAGLLRQVPPYTRLPAVDIYLLRNPKRKMTAAENLVLAIFDDLIAGRPFPERTYGQTAAATRAD